MTTFLRALACATVSLLPWRLKRYCLTAFWHYELHPTSRIGLAWVFPKRLTMHEGASIGHLTVCRSLELLELAPHAVIGRLNWIYGYVGHSSYMDPQRTSQLLLGAHAAITNRHLVDCTDSVEIGAFSILAGYHSQILTHSIDLHRSMQSSRPVRIGHYCFVGTRCVILGGSELPDHSVLGANSLLNKAHKAEYTLYGGSPAVPIKSLSTQTQYFARQVGYVQ